MRGRVVRANRGRFGGLLTLLVIAPVTIGISVPTMLAMSAAPRVVIARGALDVQPFPGTPDVSPQADIGFPALAPGQIETLTVIGSRSGPHRGRLSPLPGGHGVSFAPLHPFAEGERVSVRAVLTSPARGTAPNTPRATGLSFAFTVAVPASLHNRHSAPPARLRGHHRPRRASASHLNARTQRFRSERWLRPPLVWASGKDPDPGEGDIFADAQDNVESGPLIMDPQGRLIYFGAMTRTGAFNVEIQQFRGQSALTYWQGVGIDPGHGVILNHHYQQIATVYAGNGYGADAHEFQITPQGDALITVYAPVRADLSSIGGPRRGILMDSIVQEIDIATGKVLWEWHASGHVPLSQTHAGKPGPWPFDFFHINSIQQLPDGNLLVSGRNTWAIYEISKRTGRIMWQLGGDGSSFAMGPGTNFEWQHDARMRPHGVVTVFDNGSWGGSPNEPHSRALSLHLDLTHRRVSLVRALTSRPPQLGVSQGDVQPLADGNTFVGWGAAPYITEFGSAGRQRFSLHFPSPVQSYRAYRFKWWGQPVTPPTIAAVATTAGTAVYASWNGATDVSTWQVLAGPSEGALALVGRYRDTSFETSMSAPTTQRYIAVQALDSSGNVLGTSPTVTR